MPVKQFTAVLYAQFVTLGLVQRELFPEDVSILFGAFSICSL